MAKGDNVKRLEEDLQKALQETSDFVPLIYVRDATDSEGISLLQVDPTTTIATNDLEIIGIPFVFELTKFDVMKARALAFGVILERRYT